LRVDTDAVDVTLRIVAVVATFAVGAAGCGSDPRAPATTAPKRDYSSCQVPQGSVDDPFPERELLPAGATVATVDDSNGRLTARFVVPSTLEKAYGDVLARAQRLGYTQLGTEFEGLDAEVFLERDGTGVTFSMRAAPACGQVSWGTVQR
jgi:hypothetical protein